MKDLQTEIQEALCASDTALVCLRRARERLGSASRWGVVDLLGGGLFSGVMKQRRMTQANEELANARYALQEFARELRDVRGLSIPEVQLNDFLSFADLFLDGAIADWFMQSRIAAARRQVDSAIEQVERIRRALN